MPNQLDAHRIRQVILNIVGRYSRGSIQTQSVLSDALEELGLNRKTDTEQALLTIWHDLFRTGHLAWGYDISNPNPPFCHVTEQGRRALANLTRDPANPEGYINHLSSLAQLNEVAKSYVDEALRTYNADCYKASAVMIGAASECMLLELRDTLIEKTKLVHKTASDDLTNWRIKRVVDSLHRQFVDHKDQMDPNLFNMVQQYWEAFIGQIRTARNESGHPNSIDVVTQETVHASLLIFPELAKMISLIKNWIKTDYS